MAHFASQMSSGLTQCKSTLGCLRDAAPLRFWRPDEEELHGESVRQRRDPLLWYCLLLVAVSQCLVSVQCFFLSSQ